MLCGKKYYCPNNLLYHIQGLSRNSRKLIGNKYRVTSMMNPYGKQQKLYMCMYIKLSDYLKCRQAGMRPDVVKLCCWILVVGITRCCKYFEEQQILERERDKTNIYFTVSTDKLGQISVLAVATYKITHKISLHTVQSTPQNEHHLMKK